MIHHIRPCFKPSIGNGPESMVYNSVKIRLCREFVHTRMMIAIAMRKSIKSFFLVIQDSKPKKEMTNRRVSGDRGAIPKYWSLVMSILFLISKPK